MFLEKCTALKFTRVDSKIILTTEFRNELLAQEDVLLIDEGKIILALSKLYSKKFNTNFVKSTAGKLAKIP